MSRWPSTLGVLSSVMLLLTACTSGTAPEIHDFDVARSRWLATRPHDYDFEVAIRTAWFPPSGFRRIAVREGRVVAVHQVDTGEPLSLDHAITIDDLWDLLIAARNDGQSLTDLRFSPGGVPLEAMVGTFANDGGVHYLVRALARR